MRFKCSSCSKEINIPENRLPDTPKFKVKCPHCQERVVLDKDAPDGQPKSEMEMAPDLTNEADEADFRMGSSAMPDPEIFPPGARVVFMALKSQRWIETAIGFFSEMGYYDSRAMDEGEAVMKLRLNDYHVLLLEDTPKSVPILKEIAKWSGLKRRKLNVVAIGDNAQSLDPQLAFRKGINTYINVHDQEKGHELLGMALKAYDEYYRYLHMAEEKG